MINSLKEALPDERSDGRRPDNKSRDPQVYWIGQTSHIEREQLENLTKTLEPPPKTLEILRKQITL